MKYTLIKIDTDNRLVDNIDSLEEVKKVMDGYETESVIFGYDETGNLITCEGFKQKTNGTLRNSK